MVFRLDLLPLGIKVVLHLRRERDVLHSVRVCVM